MDQAASRQSRPVPDLPPVENLLVVVSAVRHYNPDSGFQVVQAHPEKSRTPKSETFTAVGLLGGLRTGEKVYLSGAWMENRYGLQLQVRDIGLPDFSGSGVLSFLEGGYVKGIGPALAKEIYRCFGDNTSTILDAEPDKLLEVKGVGQAKLAMIKESWEENRGKRDAITFFRGLGLGPMTTQKILKRWKNPDEAMRVVKDNPYLLAWEIHGIGFKSADKTAQSLGIAATDPKRLQACTAFVLDEAAKTEGHCFLERDDLTRRVCAFVAGPEQGQPNSALLDGIHTAVETLLVNQKLCAENGMIYLAGVHRHEVGLAQTLQALSRGKVLPPLGLDGQITAYERKHGITLHVKQKEALKTSVGNKISVITGGPGTGKTTIVKLLLELSQAQEGVKKVVLCAPTGRAAKRLAESTGRPASTIHRLLEFKPGAGFIYNRENPLGADLVICDEASMLDVFLAYALCSAMKPSARMVFVGDVHQLPSVGAGNVLKDLIGSGKIPTIYLSQVYRQSANSWIAMNATAILRGQIKEMNLTNRTDDFIWAPVAEDAEEAVDKARAIQAKIIKAVSWLLTKGFGEPDIQVLSPTYKGAVGVDALNSLLQGLFNPHGRRFKIGFREYGEGDRVMQLRNNYDKDVFNGDQGRILSWDNDEGKAVVEFDGRQVEYARDEMDELTLAYCITVHKSQGSESPCIVQPVSTCQYVMLQRSILYTGVTRARKMCVLIGQKKALSMAIRNDRVDRRNTALAERI